MWPFVANMLAVEWGRGVSLCDEDKVKMIPGTRPWREAVSSPVRALFRDGQRGR